MAVILNFRSFAKNEKKHRFASLSLTMRDRAISRFSTHRVSQQTTLCNFQKKISSPQKWRPYCIFVENGKTQIGFLLLNRAR